MKVKTTFVAAALAGLTTMLMSGPAAADVIKVSPGGSIQAAMDQAAPGDTVKLAPGTYRESVQIKTDDITLKGSGTYETVIEPGTPSAPGTSICEGSDGICVADADVPDPNAPPVVNREVADVRVKGLTVRGFDFSGVFFFGTRDQRVNDVLAEDNHEYGIAAFNTTGGQYWDNVTRNDGEAGIYVGDSPEAHAVVRDNVSYNNLGDGIFIRDASHGVVEDNETFGNCIGILFLETPQPTENSDWVARDNSANQNNNACPAGDEGEALSGLGIVIFGAHAITLVDNAVNGNKPGGDTVASGGIIVLSDSQGGFTATDNVIKHNTAFGNLPVDLLWDEQGDNTFIGNRCNTSDPDGLCVKGHGQGDGHHGNDGDDGDHGHNGHHGDKHGKHNHKHHKHNKHHDD
jgi:nitrous oxidase accessory protein NosD